MCKQSEEKGGLKVTKGREPRERERGARGDGRKGRRGEEKKRVARFAIFFMSCNMHLGQGQGSPPC